MDLLSSLNPMQQEAVLVHQGPLLILAGAGSGKTKALTTRIAYLIEHHQVNPWNILAVTFTNKAANEMKSRIAKLLQQHSLELPFVGTFHSICVRLLRKHIHQLGYANSFSIYDTTDQQILMKRIMEELQIDTKKVNPRAVLTFISGAKNQLLSPEEYRRYANNYFTEKVSIAYVRYQRELEKASALDFDDIIMKTVELFQTHPAILEHYQEHFRYICVDEYQDTNHAQYVLTNLLAKKYRNLCVIGDSDQSIYAFRGANIQNILDFEKDYPDAKVIYLEQNYRSSPIILRAAQAVIEKNTRRKEKTLWTERQEGEKITQISLPTEREEGEFVAENILKIRRAEGEKSYRDCVILYRTDAQSRVVEEAMLKFGIPYKIVGGIKFYERKEIKDLLSYLRLINNPSDTVSLLRIINVPARKIGEKTIETIQRYAVRENISFWQALKDLEKIEELRGAASLALQHFVQLIAQLKTLNRSYPAAPLIKHLLELSGYKKFLDDGTPEGESRLQNVYELISVASKYDKLNPGESLSVFLEEVALIADVDNLDEQEDSVTLMTVHSAKGLEFSVVFLIGLEDGIFPHSRSLLERDELEEERRLMYVALTRAKDKLFLLHTRNRLLYGESQSNPPSQFIQEIPQDLFDALPSGKVSLNMQESRFFRPIPEETDQGLIYHQATSKPAPEQDKLLTVQRQQGNLRDGDRVLHDTFGEGTVISLQGGVATICFKSKKYGIKKLALSVAPLRKIE